MEIILIIIVSVALYIYLKMYNSHPFFLLDKNGVVKKNYQKKFWSSSITINPKDFLEFEKIHKKYFPQGSLNLLKSHSSIDNTLLIDTTVSNELYFPISFIVRKIEESPEHYYMYLFEDPIAYEGNILRGKLYEGSLPVLKENFESWTQKQLEYLKKYEPKLVS